MNGRKYITDLEVGREYKTKHYRKWLIYLGEYRMITPWLSIENYHVFMKNRQGKKQFVLYEKLKRKLFHLKGNLIEGIDPEKLKKDYLPPMIDSSWIIDDFDYIGKEVSSLYDLLELYTKYNEREWKKSKYLAEISFEQWNINFRIKLGKGEWKDYSDFNSTYRQIVNKLKINKPRLKNYTIRPSIFSSMPSNCAVYYANGSDISVKDYKENIEFDYPDPPYIVGIKGIRIHFTNGIEIEFNSKDYSYEYIGWGIGIKINEVS